MEEYNQSFKKEVGGGGLISLKKKSQVLHSLFLTFIFYSLVCSRESLLHTVTIACLRLAAKVSEEEELIPRIKDFIRYCGSDYTPSEVLRMELAILDRLHWDLCIGTPLDFLNVVSTGGLQSLP